ncbi:hypothetical protein [Modicisalibacter xianhensis]|uniref:Uncharacterized protein n=1 Tax=Modicisalibacter xianhensis TaxID=442341 RepID=A0A1I2ZJM3_9GAMM|nr:hypothetical protein [Halomonas xianhensis]SFH38062.1 hypothetical protein SAMN04487959_103174 [Halomonas xianhensis]
MRERFTIDHLVYEVRVSHRNEITFAIVGGANSVYQSWTYDPLDSVDDWDIEPNITEDIGVSRYPLRVYREVLKRTMCWLGGARPKAFTFTLQSERRRWIYERTARHLAQRFDYDLQVTGRTYRFFKLKHSDQEAS